MKKIMFFYLFVSSLAFSNLKLMAQGITVDICGQILDPTGICIGFEGVQVDIKDAFGNVLCTTTSGVNGNYCCTVPVDATPVDICPHINCPGGNGSQEVIDLIDIQRFLLGNPNNPSGIWPFDFTLWADVNGDGSISVADLVLLRDIILGANTEFNTCRLVNQNCLLTTSPPDFHTCYDNCLGEYDPFSLNDGTLTNFLLFRIGDVNNSWSPAPDCSVPLWTETQNQIVHRGHNANRKIYFDHFSGIINFETECTTHFLMLELEFDEDLDYTDFLVDNENLNMIVDKNRLIVSFFSNSIEEAILLKDIIKVHSTAKLTKINYKNSALISTEGVFGLHLDIKGKPIDHNNNIIKITRQNIVTIFGHSDMANDMTIIVSSIDGRTLFTQQVRISADFGFDVDLARIPAKGLMYITVQSKDTGDITTARFLKID